MGNRFGWARGSSSSAERVLRQEWSEPGLLGPEEEELLCLGSEGCYGAETDFGAPTSEVERLGTRSAVPDGGGVWEPDLGPQ